MVLGKRPSAVGTLVERHSRYVVLFPLPEGFTAQRMGPALTAAVLQLPQQLRRSLTWDHGREMAEHTQFTIDSGVQVYFCDPRSPWQRGTTKTPTASSANTCPKVATCAGSTRPRWMPSPLSSTAVLDKPWAIGHPHRHSRRRCPDHLRPPWFPGRRWPAGADGQSARPGSWGPPPMERQYGQDCYRASGSVGSAADRTDPAGGAALDPGPGGAPR